MDCELFLVSNSSQAELKSLITKILGDIIKDQIISCNFEKYSSMSCKYL